jgi:hypothetical protein
MGTSVRVLVGFEGSFGQYVDVMSALTLFSSQIKNLNITFYSPQAEYLHSAKSYWCVNNVAQTFNPADYDVAINMISDRASSMRYEMAYRQSLKNNIDSQIQQIAKQKQVAPEQVQKPPGYEILAQPNSIYNRQHSYLIHLIYELLTPCNIPFDIPIIIPTAPGTKDKVNKLLHENRKQLKPSLPYILISNSDMLLSRELTIPYPENWGVLTVDLEHIEAQLVSGLITNPRCVAVVSKAGELSRIAAVHGTPCIIELTDDPNMAGWDCTRTENSVVLDVANEFSDNSKFMAATTTHLRNCFGYNSLT